LIHGLRGLHLIQSRCICGTGRAALLLLTASPVRISLAGAQEEHGDGDTYKKSQEDAAGHGHGATARERPVVIATTTVGGSRFAGFPEHCGIVLVVTMV